MFRRRYRSRRGYRRGYASRRRGYGRRGSRGSRGRIRRIGYRM